MMMNHGVADGLSDQELSQAVKGGGSVPGWLALSVLNSRNQIRASAPVQAPQGSIADSVVSKALGQAGLGQQAQQPQQNQGISGGLQPQSQGIASQAPQSFAKGGILSLAGGTTQDNQSQQDASSYYLPQHRDLTPQTISYNPTVNPNATTLDQAQTQIQPMYGKTPDYQGQIDKLNDSNKKSQVNQNGWGQVGRNVSNLAASMAANSGQPGGMYAGWGKGMIANSANEDKQRQQNFENNLKTSEGTEKVTDDQSRRAQAMASATQSYAEHQQGLAQSQDQIKLGVQEHNASQVTEATKDFNKSQQDLSKDKIDLARNQGDPDTLLSMINDAKSKGDTKTVNALSPLLAGINKQRNDQLQKSSDISEGAHTREAEAQGNITRQNEAYSSALEEGRAEKADARKKAGTMADDSHMDAAVDQVGTYHQSMSQMLQRVPFAQKSQFMEAIKAKYPNWNPDTEKALGQAANDKTTVPAANAIRHMGMLSDYYNAQKSGNNQTLNSINQKIKTEFGSDISSNPNAIATNIADEISKGYGQSNVSSVDAFKKILMSNQSPDQKSGAIDGQIKAMSEAQDDKRKRLTAQGVPSNHPVMEGLRFQPGAKEIIVSRGMDPDNPGIGKAYEGMPAGNGAHPTKEIADKFMKASGGNKDDAARMLRNFGYRW
jgi:hypothetical protein